MTQNIHVGTHGTPLTEKVMTLKALEWLALAAEKERFKSPLARYYREQASKCFRRAAILKRQAGN